MAQPSESFKQFDYALRPSKQVERKAMIEVLLNLAKPGYAISEYRYIGFGSVYYVDFIMFHKYLFIKKMVCVEWGDIEKRMRFNKPYKFVQLKLMSLSSYIPHIRPKDRVLAWLDYDRALDLEMIQDIDGMCSRIAPKSVFAITVDARPKLPKDLFDTDKLTVDQREELTFKTYNRWFAEYLPGQIPREMVSRAEVAALFYEIIVDRIKRTLGSRGLQFIQLFNYYYRDGAPMLTVGGLVGIQSDVVALQAAGVLQHKYVRSGKESLTISVPPLTLREKHWLDARLYGKVKISDLRFELQEELLQNYCTFYKEYPTYLESFL
ncbi:MAG TPA: O-methyltransferase [Chthoniobacterales bacterium]|nr:O-methyltransferase [Chthoniobacterales bacterium]